MQRIHSHDTTVGCFQGIDLICPSPFESVFFQGCAFPPHPSYHPFSLNVISAFFHRAYGISWPRTSSFSFARVFTVTFSRIFPFFVSPYHGTFQGKIKPVSQRLVTSTPNLEILSLLCQSPFVTSFNSLTSIIQSSSRRGSTSSSSDFECSKRVDVLYFRLQLNTHDR